MNNKLRPPGPHGHWLWGNISEFRREKLAFFTRCAREFGDVSSFRLGTRRLVLAAHPDDIERILVTENRKFIKHYVIQLLRPALGNGLLLSDGDFWRRQRRLAQPSFTHAAVQSYAGVVIDYARRLADSWQHGQTIDVHEAMSQLALQVASKALLGVEAADLFQEVKASMEVLLADFSLRFESAFAIPRWIPTPWNRRVNHKLRQLHELIARMIDERRQSSTDRNDLLARLMRARDEEDASGMSDQQLRDELVTFFLAGHETTANALSWTCYLLAQNPDIESRLLDEVRAVDLETEAAGSNVAQLKLTHRVIKESMRLFPPVYAFGRKATERCRLGDFEVPAGTTVIMSQWVTHRDPRWFERPEEFDPDRWTGEAAGRIPRYAYFPFGGGPRVCIGNEFASMEMALVLATILPRFRMTLATEEAIRPMPRVTLRPATTMRVKLTQRSLVPTQARRPSDAQRTASQAATS